MPLVLELSFYNIELVTTIASILMPVSCLKILAETKAQSPIWLPISKIGSYQDTTDTNFVQLCFLPSLIKLFNTLISVKDILVYVTRLKFF